MFFSKALTRALLLVIVLATSAITLAQGPVALTESGTISGIRENGLSVYKGVPFAAHRQRHALAASGACHTLDWHAQNDCVLPACMQVGVSMPGETPPSVSEDCLYLNIWTPSKPQERLPVIVWIYGGGYVNGSASMPLYRGDQLVSSLSRSHTASSAWLSCSSGADPHPAFIYGLIDEIAALEWIQRNIAAFGGDPKN